MGRRGARTLDTIQTLGKNSQSGGESSGESSKRSGMSNESSWYSSESLLQSKAFSVNSPHLFLVHSGLLGLPLESQNIFLFDL